MAIDEIERTAMVQQLINTLGEQPTNTLMKCILPDGADQVATKADIRALEAATKADISALKVDIEASEARLRADFKTDLATLTQTLVAQNRTQMFTMAGFMITIWVTVLVTGLT